MKRNTLLLLFLCFQISIFGQLDYKQKSKTDGANYFEIVNNTRSYFNKYKKKGSVKLSKQEKQFERWAFYWKDRVSKNGAFPTETLGYFNAGVLDENGKIAINKYSQKSQSAETWTNIGPQQNPIPNGYSNYPQLGRLNSFLRIKHPSDRSKDVLFVGAPSGGLWKSTDNGATWSPKLDNVAGIGVTDIKTAATTTFANYTTKPIYVSTGDYDASHVKSIGILKSTDGGDTFVSTGLSYNITDQKSTGEMIVSDDNTVIVGDDRYIKKTTDGGANWTNIFDSQTNATFGRVATTGTNILYSGYFDMFFSPDSGATWSIVNASNGQNKHALTVGSDGFIYAQDSNGQLKKFDTATKTFANIGSIAPGYNSQGGYNQALIVKDGLIITGELNGQTSTDNGVTWTRTINGYYNPAATPGPKNDGFDLSNDGLYVHSDHHGMGHLDGQYEFWSVNDGGLNFITFSSVNDVKPTTEYKSNGVINSQLYDVAITPNLNTGNYVMALQDNDGYSREMHNGKMEWIAAAAGDGVAAAINYNNPKTRYLASQKGGLTKVANGFSGKVDGDSFAKISGAAFVWPLEIHTTDPTILYAGGDEIYKLTDSDANASIATVISNATNLNSGAGEIQKITTHGSGIAVVGDTSVKLSINSGTSWTTITNPGGLPINSVDFNQSTMSTLYCSVSGYSNGNKIFKSTDSGANWTNISAGLPNVVIKEVVLKQNQGTEILFAATELGVYFKYGASNWTKLGTALPNVDVRDIDINYTEDKLVAATFGRGLWQINIANNTLSTENIEIADNQFRVYPNPIKDGKFNFSIDKKYANFNYKIYNVLGGVVLEGKRVSENGTINVSNLSNGMYMFKAFKDGVNFPSVKLLVSNK